MPDRGPCLPKLKNVPDKDLCVKGSPRLRLGLGLDFKSKVMWTCRGSIPPRGRDPNCRYYFHLIFLGGREDSLFISKYQQVKLIYLTRPLEWPTQGVFH